MFMIKKILNYKLYIIGALSILIILFTTFTFVSFYVARRPVSVADDSLVHDYVTTTVIEKRYEEGNGFFWWYKAPSYYITSVDDNDMTWVTSVDQTTFDTTLVGDIYIICTTHNKLKEYEK